MLKKLRFMFVLVNMILVTVMLSTIFGLLYYSTARNLERQSLQMMENIAMSPQKHGPPVERHDDIRLPYFTVLLDRQAEPVEISGEFFDLSDREQLRAILRRTFDDGAQSGLLKEYGLRFFCSETPMGPCIVYADVTSEQATLENLIRTFALIGAAAFFAFLGISAILAHWAVRPVERAWQQQKQFVADASHELKTPLTVIMTDAELLHAPDCPDSDRKPLSGSILTMSSQMRGLVESLLELARLDSGSVREEFGVLSLSEAVSDAAMLFEPVFFEKGLTLSAAIEPDISVNGVLPRLKQLVGILLENAAKYASSGGAAVIRLTRSAHRRCVLEVSNEGAPIGEEDRENIFKRFYRADKARAMNHSYGLGLSIAQSIVHEHKGTIRCESADGWNRFFVELPRI